MNNELAGKKSSVIYNLSSNDDIQPSTVVSNQLPSGSVF